MCEVLHFDFKKCTLMFSSSKKKNNNKKNLYISNLKQQISV